MRNRYYRNYKSYRYYIITLIILIAPIYNNKKKQATLELDSLLIYIYHIEVYNTNYFGDCRSGLKRSILCVCEHLAHKQDAERVVLDTFD